MADRTTFEGGCHCGNIRFAYVTQEGGRGVQPRRCACEFCTRHGNVYVSDPGGELAIQVKDDGAVSRYRFGHETADFLVCRICGVMPVVVSRIDGNDYGIVNHNAIDEAPVPARDLPTADLGGETREIRLARRKSNWIGTVTIS